MDEKLNRNEFFNNLQINPASVDMGNLGSYVFEKSLIRYKGLAYRNLNNVTAEEVGVFLKSKNRRIKMNYRNKGDRRIYIPFRFKSAPKTQELLTEIIMASPVIDYLIVFPSERGRVTLPSDIDCVFVELKTGGENDNSSYSENQDWVFYKYREHNILIAQINLNWDPKISFRLPSNDNYEPLILPCGVERPRNDAGFDCTLSSCLRFCDRFKNLPHDCNHLMEYISET